MPSLDKQMGVLGTELAAHLLKRSSYVVSLERINEFADYTAEEAVNLLTEEIGYYNSSPIHPETEDYFIDLPDEDLPSEAGGARRNYVLMWWIDEAHLDTSIQSKMVFFLHTCFTTANQPLHHGKYFDHFTLLRYFSLGNFKTLAKKICVDHAMLGYLDNNLNSKEAPNENFAREFLELFTIGRGPQVSADDYTNYTEADIIQAARLLTGFTNNPNNKRQYTDLLDPDTNIFRGRAAFQKHDTEDKTFSHRFGGQTIKGATNKADMWRELDEFVEMIFAQDATAINVVKRLYIFFVGKTISPAIEQDIILPLAQELKNKDYEINPILRKLLKSAHFFGTDDNDPKNNVIGAFLKSPLDLLLHTINMLEVELPRPSSEGIRYKRVYLTWMMRSFFVNTGMDIFMPSDVAGYPAYYQEGSYYREWFNSSTITTRYLLGEMLLTGRRVVRQGNIGGVKVDIVKWFLNNFQEDPSNATYVVTQFLKYFFPIQPNEERFNYFLNDIFLDGLSPLSWLYDNWQPFEESNFRKASFVRTPLENLLKAILYSPEYQLM